jgi:hypothetical protein
LSQNDPGVPPSGSGAYRLRFAAVSPLRYETKPSSPLTLHGLCLLGIGEGGGEERAIAIAKGRSTYASQGQDDLAHLVPTGAAERPTLTLARSSGVHLGLKRAKVNKLFFILAWRNRKRGADRTACNRQRMRFLRQGRRL